MRGFFTAFRMTTWRLVVLGRLQPGE
jgi:hypothetical protein